MDNYDLQFIYYLKGCLHNYLSDREKAVESFSEAKKFENQYGELFRVGLGASTYTFIGKKSGYIPEITYLEDNNIKSELPAIVISLEENILRNYGSIILNNILSLRKYYFHIHIVSITKNVQSVIYELQSIFKSMMNFFQKKIL